MSNAHIRLELLPRIKDDILPLYHNFLRSEMTQMIQVSASQVSDIKKCLHIMSEIYCRESYEMAVSDIREYIDILVLNPVFESIDKIINRLEPIIGKNKIDEASRNLVKLHFHNNSFIESLMQDF